MPAGFDVTRLKDKIKAAFAAYNDTDVADIPDARDQIAEDLATAFIEEMQFAKVTVPGLGLAAGATVVTGTSITGNLT